MTPSQIPDAARRIIVNFHGVGPAPRRGYDPGEERYWLSTQTFRTAIEAIARARDAGRAVKVTFDDGNLSDLACAAPVLARHGLQATFFVLAGRLEQPEFLSPADIQELMGMGMGIGSHGADHVDWRQLDAATAQREMVWARDRISDLTGQPVTEAAIPFGAYNAEVLRRLSDAGFHTAYTSDGGVARTRAFVQPRSSLTRDIDQQGVERILSGQMPVRRRVRRAAAMWMKRLR